MFSFPVPPFDAYLECFCILVDIRVPSVYVFDSLMGVGALRYCLVLKNTGT